MWKLYILYSESRDKYYVGSTGDDLSERLRRHNSNHRGFTGGVGDWVVKYEEVYHNHSEAIRREKQVKDWKSRQRVEQLIRSAHSGF